MTDPTDTPPWHTERRQVLDFARVLTAANALTTATDALDYLDGPHRFDPEHTLWTRAGHPQPPNADDRAAARMLGHTSPEASELHRRHRSAGTAWDAFCGLLDDFDHTGRPLRLLDRP